jgi:hypothetical protein
MSDTLVNASIPLQAKAPDQPNPLATIGQFAQTANALNSLKMFPGQRELQQQAIQQGQQGIQGNQANLVQQWKQQGAQALVPLLAKDGPITHSDITTALAGAEKAGVSTQPILAITANIPITGNPTADDKAFRAAILANAQAPAAAAGAVVPGMHLVDTGPSLQPYTTPAAGMPGFGALTSQGTAIRKDLTPAESAQPVPGPVDQKTGARTTETLGQFISDAGGMPDLGTGRLPPALLNPNKPKGVVTSLGPAQEAVLSKQGSASGGAFADIASAGVEAKGQNAVLGNMLADSKQFTTGPTSLNINKATLTRYTPALARQFGIDPESVAANESFDKLANQIANAQGASSDAHLSVAQHANPNSSISQAGADLIIRQLQGNADYLQARAKLAAQYPDQTNRAGFEVDPNWGGALDPRAFQYNRMTPQQRVAYAKSLSPEDRKTVAQSFYKIFGQKPAAPPNAQ